MESPSFSIGATLHREFRASGNGRRGTISTPGRIFLASALQCWLREAAHSAEAVLSEGCRFVHKSRGESCQAQIVVFLCIEPYTMVLSGVVARCRIELLTEWRLPSEVDRFAAHSRLANFSAQPRRVESSASSSP